MTTSTADTTRAERELLDPEGLGADEVKGTGVIARIYAAWWSLLCSLPRAMFLIALLGASCFVGMFFDQTKTYEEHAAEWAQQAWKLKLFTFLEMNDVFGSWWFVLIIVYLLVSIISCSVERFPKIWKDALNPKKDLSDEQLRGIRFAYRGKTVDRAKAVGLFKRIFPRADVIEREGTTYLFSEAHRFARFGVYIIHLGLVTIFVGGTLVNLTKVDGLMMVPEGYKENTVRVYGPGRLPTLLELHFSVRCDDFRLKTFVDGAPMEFESDLSVWDPASPVNPVVRKKIQVNDPLVYKGYTFYQASYNPIPGDQRVQLDLGPRGQERRTYDLAIGDRLQMPDGTVFVPVEVIQDFAGLGAAVRVQETPPSKDGAEKAPTTSYVVFRSYPTFDRDVRRGAYDVQFRGFDQTYATGLQVGRVPWIPMVFGGFLVMFVGMFMAFFMSHRRYWARIAPDGTLVVAGAARRHQHAYAEEWALIDEVFGLAFGKGESVADRARALRAARPARADKAPTPYAKHSTILSRIYKNKASLGIF
jgi:cytochrome c biogenesis protein